MRRRQRENQSPMLSGMIGIVMICFGVFWTIMAGTIFFPMAIFGILWTAVAVMITVNNFKKEKSTERPRQPEEPRQNYRVPEPETTPKEMRCPYCGAPITRESKKCEYCDTKF